jgi:hypothetical protein
MLVNMAANRLFSAGSIELGKEEQRKCLFKRTSEPAGKMP